EIRARRPFRGSCAAAAWRPARVPHHRASGLRRCRATLRGLRSQARPRAARAARSRGVDDGRGASEAAGRGVLAYPARSGAGRELGGGGLCDSRRRRSGDVHRKVTPETLDRAAVQLAGARLADAHLGPSLAQRELIAVIPRDDLTLASRKPPQRVLNSCVEIFLLVPLGEAVVDGRALMRTLVHEDVERHRELGRLVSTGGATSLVNTTKLVDHRTADAQLRLGLERHTAARINTVDGRVKTDHRRGRIVI